MIQFDEHIFELGWLNHQLEDMDVWMNKDYFFEF